MRIEFEFLYAHSEHHKAGLFLEKNDSLSWAEDILTSIKPEGSLLSSQEFAIGVYPVSDESIPHPHNSLKSTLILFCHLCLYHGHVMNENSPTRLPSTDIPSNVSSPHSNQLLLVLSLSHSNCSVSFCCWLSRRGRKEVQCRKHRGAGVLFNSHHSCSFLSWPEYRHIPNCVSPSDFPTKPVLACAYFTAPIHDKFHRSLTANSNNIYEEYKLWRDPG
jgi:hypothetical protein